MSLSVLVEKNPFLVKGDEALYLQWWAIFDSNKRPPRCQRALPQRMTRFYWDSSHCLSIQKIQKTIQYDSFSKPVQKNSFAAIFGCIFFILHQLTNLSKRQLWIK